LILLTNLISPQSSYLENEFLREISHVKAKLRCNLYQQVQKILFYYKLNNKDLY